MKIEDMPTPETDALDAQHEIRRAIYFPLRYSDYQAHARSLEQRLGLALAALRKIEINDDCYESAPIAKAALAQIEEGK
jgi:hypothetical protein